MYKNYCYIRISTDKQLYDRQLEILKNAGYTSDNSIYIEETYTGKKKNRPLFDKMINEMQKGDTLIVESLSRLGRSIVNNNEIINYLINKKQCNIIILKENFNLKANGEMDSMTKLLLNIFSVFAEFERDQLSERTKEGIKATRAKGTRVGKPRTERASIQNFIKVLEYMINNNVGQDKATMLCNFPKDTFKRDIKKMYQKYNTKDYNELLNNIKSEVL